MPKGRAHKRQEEREKREAISSSTSQSMPLLISLDLFNPDPPHLINSETPLLSREDLDARLRSLPAWRLSEDGTLLSRTFI